MTRHLDGLEQSGLVERKRDPVDRRAVQVQLTRAGHALHGRLLKAVIAFNQQLRTGLSGDDVETLRRVLGRLRENVGGSMTP
jgi:DNA-binding MarR family transcriptional regulator